MNVVYEVTAVVEDDLCDAFERFMQDVHIPDLMDTRFFESASFERSTPGRYRIRYEAASREALDQYLAQEAPRLREDFKSHFARGIVLSREDWSVVKHFP